MFIFLTCQTRKSKLAGSLAQNLTMTTLFNLFHWLFYFMVYWYKYGPVTTPEIIFQSFQITQARSSLSPKFFFFLLSIEFTFFFSITFSCLPCKTLNRNWALLLDYLWKWSIHGHWTLGCRWTNYVRWVSTMPRYGRNIDFTQNVKYRMLSK